MGLQIELIGVLFISLEAIGIKRFTKVYNFIYLISHWSKKSLLRLFFISAPPLILVSIGVTLDIKLLTGLMFPILILSYALSFLIDHPEWMERWVLIRTKEGKIGPIGFILIVIGNLLQLTSVIWQMSLDKSL